MKHTLFISDIHLDETRPNITEIFLNFLATDARQADALYILGDLFESWVGDDNHTPLNLTIRDGLRFLTESGVPVYFMHGNRDFLISRGLARETSIQLLPDPFVINLYDTRTVLTHGDLLCTQDVNYQAFRKKAHNPILQTLFLLLPLFIRKKIAAKARAKSQAHTSTTDLKIMDVTLDEVDTMLADAEALQMIHGHTHRPAIHEFTLGKANAKRIVLGDWYQHGSVLRIDETGETTLLAL